jgi:putative SOS response-associated peptidase YedK
MINARLETVASKPSFARPFRSARCVVLADGFYEWRREGEKKTPFMIHPPSEDEILGFAGLWSRWKPEKGDEVLSCTIITRPAAGAAAKIHERMPAILPRASWPDWLKADPADPKALMKALDEAPTPEARNRRSRPRSTTRETILPASSLQLEDEPLAGLQAPELRGCGLAACGLRPSSRLDAWGLMLRGFRSFELIASIRW